MLSENLDFYYGSFKALENIKLTFSRTRTLAPRPLGLRQVHLPALPEPHERPHPRHPSGRHAHARRKDVNDPKVDGSICGAGGHFIPEAQPHPKTIFENVHTACLVNGVRDANFIAEREEQSLKISASGTRSKDRLHASSPGLSGGQQQRLCIAGPWP
jgi:phosphate transport system ATP-binding protein